MIARAQNKEVLNTARALKSHVGTVNGAQIPYLWICLRVYHNVRLVNEVIEWLTVHEV
jgi:hypothetical protein